MEKTINMQINMDAGAPVMEPQRQFYYMQRSCTQNARNRTDGS